MQHSWGESRMQIPTIRVVDADDEAMLAGSKTFDAPSSSTTSPPETPATESLEEDIDLDPQAHFLSPVRSYEAWDDSDDEEDDGIEWDAGIMDFALFNEDRKRAKEENVPLDAKWDELLSNQTAAYYRSVKRSNGEIKEPEFLSRNGSGDSLPGMTPDTSPKLGDDMDFEEDDDDDVQIITERLYRTVIVTPDSVKPTFGESKPKLESITESDSEPACALEDPDEDTAIYLAYARRDKPRRRQSMPQIPKLVRPGLRGSRTLSGKLHVWRRPHLGIWPVSEDASGEERAEHSDEERRERA